MKESSHICYSMQESFPGFSGHAQITSDMRSGSSIFTLFWWWLVYVPVVERKIQVRKLEYYILPYVSMLNVIEKSADMWFLLFFAGK